jgi:hypothetical protein
VPKKVALEDMSMTKRVNDSDQRELPISSDTREREKLRAELRAELLLPQSRASRL